MTPFFVILREWNTTEESKNSAFWDVRPKTDSATLGSFGASPTQDDVKRKRHSEGVEHDRRIHNSRFFDSDVMDPSHPLRVT